MELPGDIGDRQADQQARKKGSGESQELADKYFRIYYPLMIFLSSGVTQKLHWRDQTTKRAKLYLTCLFTLYVA